MTAWVSL